MKTTIELAEIGDYGGTDLGHSDYLLITQDRIDAFADVADDHQWIHVDPDRAKDGPYGGTIAHGLLTLSLVVPLWKQLFEVRNADTVINYGLDRVRYVSPVRVGSRIRMHATIATVTDIGNGWQIDVDNTVDIQGESSPALVAHSVYRYHA